MILAQVNEAIKTNMKAGKPSVVSALRSLKAELESNHKAKKPQQELEVVVAYKNKLSKALDAYVGKFDKQKEIQFEINIVQEYLPKQMSDASVDALIQEAIEALGENKNMGAVMKAVAPLTKGKYDGKRLSQRVQEALKPKA